MGLEISKRYSYSFHAMSIKLSEDTGYHGWTQAITFLGNQPSFINILAVWNFNGGRWGNRNMCNTLKRREKQMKIWDLLSKEFHNVWCFSGQVISVQFEVIHCALQNIWYSDFQKLLLPRKQFQANLTESMVIRWTYRLLRFMSIQTLNMALWKWVTSSTLPVSIKLCRLRLTKDQEEPQGPWASCQVCTILCWTNVISA